MLSHLTAEPPSRSSDQVTALCSSNSEKMGPPDKARNRWAFECTGDRWSWTLDPILGSKEAKKSTYYEPCESTAMWCLTYTQMLAQRMLTCTRAAAVRRDRRLRTRRPCSVCLRETTSTTSKHEINFLENSVTGRGTHIYEIFFPSVSLILAQRLLSMYHRSPQTRPKVAEDPTSPSESLQIWAVFWGQHEFGLYSW